MGGECEHTVHGEPLVEVLAVGEPDGKAEVA